MSHTSSNHSFIGLLLALSSPLTATLRVISKIHYSHHIVFLANFFCDSLWCMDLKSKPSAVVFEVCHDLLQTSPWYCSKISSPPKEYSILPFPRCQQFFSFTAFLYSSDNYWANALCPELCWVLLVIPPHPPEKPTYSCCFCIRVASPLPCGPLLLRLCSETGYA